MNARKQQPIDGVPYVIEAPEYAINNMPLEMKKKPILVKIRFMVLIMNW